MTGFLRLLAAGAIALSAALPAAAEPLRFPDGFFWGAATAAHQVEGSLTNDWQAYEARPGAIAHGHTSQVGVDHYRRYDEDFRLAAAMGHTMHRMSVEWSRIEPRRGEWDLRAIAHYHQVFRALKRHGLTPMVTLHHFTSPQWVADQGGWLASRTQDDFERFARFMGSEYGAEVDWWVTINEPNVYAFQAYDEGIWPPHHQNRQEALQVMANLAKGHARAYHALHARDRQDADGDGRSAVVGLAQHLTIFDPHTPWNPIDRIKAAVVDDVFNRAMLRAVTTGELRFQIPGQAGVQERFTPARGAVDFLGVNYYTRWLQTSFGPQERIVKPDAPKTDIGWEIYPEGFYRALMMANDYTRLPDGRRVPILVTENGMDDRDGKDRNAYMVSHLAQLHRAIRDGVDVQGYLHWTLMDNFEWHHGYGPQFGLYTIDRTPTGNLRRVPTPTVPLFRAIAESNALTPEILETHRSPDPTLRLP